MKSTLRARDPGLQPERTALSWHRTAFSLLIITLIVIRSGYVRGDWLLCAIGGASVILSLLLALLCRQRQQTLVRNTTLTSASAVLAKCLLTAALCTDALAIALHSFLHLLV